MAKERIDKLLSHQGFGSRKDIKRLLRTSVVLLNGKQIYDPSLGIDPENDELSVDGETVTIVKNITLMMNKIAHTVSANKDGEHQTVFDLLAPEYRTPYLQDKLHLIGRLDMDTEGLLLFTTDGTLTHRLISPKSHINKSYFVMLEREFSAEEQAEVSRRFVEGIAVGPDDNDPGFTCEPAQVRFPGQEEIASALEKSSVAEVFQRLWNGDSSHLKKPSRFAILTIYEGKYHQVKRMFTAVGNKVVFLKRLSMGSLVLDKKLAPGEYRKLSDEELNLLN